MRCNGLFCLLSNTGETYMYSYTVHIQLFWFNLPWKLEANSSNGVITAAFLCLSAACMPSSVTAEGLHHCYRSLPFSSVWASPFYWSWHAVVTKARERRAFSGKAGLLDGWQLKEKAGLCPYKPGAIKMPPLGCTLIHFLAKKKKEKKNTSLLRSQHLLTLLEAHRDAFHVVCTAVADTCTHLLPHNADIQTGRLC